MEDGISRQEQALACAICHRILCSRDGRCGIGCFRCQAAFIAVSCNLPCLISRRPLPVGRLHQMVKWRGRPPSRLTDVKTPSVDGLKGHHCMEVIMVPRKPSFLELSILVLLLQPWSAVAQPQPGWDWPGPWHMGAGWWGFWWIFPILMFGLMIFLCAFFIFRGVKSQPCWKFVSGMRSSRRALCARRDVHSGAREAARVA
jgi:uncharacterized membrane protein